MGQMARLLSAKCPHCGAQLSITSHEQVITCQYCGQKSLLDARRKTIETQGLPQAKINQTATPIIIVFISVGVLGLMGVLFSVLLFIPQSSKPNISVQHQIAIQQQNNAMKQAQDELEQATKTANNELNKAKITINNLGSSALETKSVKLQVNDLKAVDLMDLYTQAIPQVKAIEKSAQFVSMSASDLKNGAFDSTNDKSYAHMNFSYHYLDKEKPPGQDVVEGDISVRVSNGVMKFDHRKGPTGSIRPLPGPECSSKAAWDTAVSSGIPANSVAHIHYYNDGGSRVVKAVWSFRIDGHDEYRREIDGKSCKVTRSWAK